MLHGSGCLYEISRTATDSGPRASFYVCKCCIARSAFTHLKTWERMLWQFGDLQLNAQDVWGWIHLSGYCE